MPRSWSAGAWFLALVCGLGSLLTARTAGAYCRAGVDSKSEGECVEDPDVPRLHWEPRTCSRYAFNQDVFERLPALRERGVRAAFEAAFASWSAVDCRRGGTPFLVDQARDVTTADAVEFLWDVPNESIVLARTPAEWAEADLDPAVIALTTVFHDPDNGEIYDVDTALNLGAGEFGDCAGSCASNLIDLSNTITHEAGHYLGLGHSTVRGATMTPHAGKQEVAKVSLEDDDREGYCALDLPAFECDGSDCNCPGPPIYKEVEATVAPAAAGCAAGAQRPSSNAALCLAALAGLLGLASARRARQRR